MNKLLQHIMNAGDVDHKLLPGLQKMQKGGSGKVLPKQSVDPRVFPKETLENREKVYRTVRPTDYTDLKNYIRYTFNNDRDEYDDARSEEAFKMYLGLEPKPEYFRPSKYKPTINATPNEYYYSADDQLEQDIFNSFKDKVKPGQILPTDEWFVDSEFPGNPNAFWENGKQMVKFQPDDDNPFYGRPMVSRARALGKFVVSRGEDEQGEYLSYADQYDFPEKLQDKMQGKPYKIYGRVYYPKPKKMYGGDDNPYRVFAQEGVEYQGPSIVDYLATKGYSGKKAFRKDLAEKYSIEDYNFSAAKNTELLNRLRENDDLLQQNYEPTQAPIPVERMMEMERQARAARQAVPVESAPAQRPANPAPVYNYSPEFQNMRIPQTKVNTSLQPKVIYDNKFSLSPKMVVQVPAVPRVTAPVNKVVPPVTAERPQTVIPKFDPYAFLQNSNQRPLGPVVTNRPITREAAPIQREEAPIPGISKPMDETFMFPNEYPYSFKKQEYNPISSVVPANKPLVKTEKYTTESETQDASWYDKAASTLKGFYDDFAKSVNDSPLDFRGMNFGTGFSPEGAKDMVKDLTIRAAALVSPEKGRLADNYFKRQDLKNNDNLQETKTKLTIPVIDKSPDIITGDTIPMPVKNIKTDIENRYIIPGQIDLANTKWGYRNRGDYKNITTEGGDVTLFEDLVPAKDYFKNNPNSKETDSFIGLNPDGSIVAGQKKDFINSNAVISHTTSNKIIEFPRDANGKLLLKNVSSKASNRHLTPVTKTLQDDGKIVSGSLNFLIPKQNKDPNSFGDITGGRVIFKAPDGKMKLAIGSAENIAQVFEQFKKEGNYPYLTAFNNDNGTYGPGLRTKSGNITGKDLEKYQGANSTGSVFMYLKPGDYNRVGAKATTSEFKDVPMNTPNIRTKNDESFKKGHSLTNEQKAIILHHTGYSDTTGVSKGMSKAMQGVAKQFSQPGESSHVVIDFDGTRYNYARPDQVTFHAGKSILNGRDNVNDFGVGIEFQGDTDRTRLTDKQINSFVEYAGPIIKKNKIPLSSIITHKQIRTNYMKANPKDKEVLGKADVNQIDYDRIIKVLKKKGYYAQGGLVKMQRAGQYLTERDATSINTTASSKMFGAQREIDSDRFSEDAFKQKYKMTPHQYKMSTDSDYAQSFQRQMDDRRQNDPNYSELNLPATDVRSKLYRGNPNLALIPKGATGPARAQQEQLFTDMTSMATPMLPFKSLPGMLAARRAVAPARIPGQLSVPPSSITITPTGSVNSWGDLSVSSPNWDGSAPAWETTRGVRDWPTSNFNSGFYNKTNSLIGDTVKKIDEGLGKLLSKRKTASNFDPDEITKLINENLSKGVGVKKENLPLQVKYAPWSGDDDSAYRLETLINNNKVGDIYLQRNANSYKPKTLSEILLSKVPGPLENWQNTPGFRKKGDFPFRFYDEFNPLKDPTGKTFNTVNDLYKTGISGEYNKAINETLKQKGLGNILSGGTGHSVMGEARWKNLVQKGLAEDIGNGYFKLKKDGGPIIDPRGQWAHPGKITRIPSDNITMQGVPYPVFGVGSNGQKQMMYPEQDYNFGGASYVDEYPMMRNGGGLLSKTISCSDCGWSWKAAEGGIDPLTCHKCGAIVKMQGGGTLPKMQMAGSLLQPITVQDMGNVLSSLSVPQKLITKAFTGKYQTPSEAMDIKNPYGAFAVNAVLDPVNLFGVGLLGKMAKASTKSGVLSKTYKINPLAKKKPDVILTRTQKPGQTDELRRLDEFEKKGIDNLNFMERFEYKQMLNSELSRPGYGRGFSSDLGDISYYSYPNIQTTRGYEGFPEILKTRLPAKEAEKFNVGKNALQGYVSFAPKREFLLPKDLLYSSESFIPNKGYSAGPVGANGPGSVRDFVRKAYAEQRSANIPNWLTGYPSGKEMGGSTIDQFFKTGGYTVTRSNDRKGKTHKVTGPGGVVKYFGDSNLGQHPKDPKRKAAFYARHKSNLAGNPFFRAFARKTWEDGGQTDYMQGGGLWDTDKVAYLDSTVNANKNLEFIQRAMQNNGMSIPTPKSVPGYKPGQTSSHLMTFDPKSARSYPEVVNMNGTLKYLTGDDAYNYAEDTGEYIQFPTAEKADYFSQNYKKSNYIKVGKQPLEKKHGIKVNYKK